MSYSPTRATGELAALPTFGLDAIVDQVDVLVAGGRDRQRTASWLAASTSTSRRSPPTGPSAATTASRSRRADTADDIGAWVGDLIATRRNDRTLITSSGQFVRNRDQWTVTAIDGHGDITAARIDGGGVVVFPAEYARDHVRLGYAATEPGNQSDTQDRSLTLATASTTGRVYVGMTRGRQANHALVVTDTNDLAAAHDILERVITCDRADVPAVTRREQLVGHVSSDRSTEVLRQWLEAADTRPPRPWTGGIEMD
ncbi:MAG: hypothetical protein AB7Q42_18330 [Acidimicrobiia bacterium]